MTLLQLQRDVRAWLEDGSEASAARFPIEAADGLSVYQNNYRAQLAGCLEESFPVTLAWLGAAAFHQAIVDHVARVPPSSWTLDAYPSGFPNTLNARYPDDPEVGELAALELALAEAFVAPDPEPLAIDLASVDWDRARFRFSPTMSLHPIATNAPAIWSATVAGHEPPPVARLTEPRAIIVWRTDESCRFRSVGADERSALEFLRSADSTFGALCGGNFGTAEDIGGWLGQWLADALIDRLDWAMAADDAS